MDKKLEKRIGKRLHKIARMTAKELVDEVQFLEAIHTGAGTLLCLQISDHKCDNCDGEDMPEMTAEAVMLELVRSFKDNMERNVQMNCAVNKLDFGAAVSSHNQEVADEIIKELEGSSAKS